MLKFKETTDSSDRSVRKLGRSRTLTNLFFIHKPATVYQKVAFNETILKNY